MTPKFLTRPFTTCLVALSLLAAMLGAASVASSASISPRATVAQAPADKSLAVDSKPTIVLVHGAFADSSGWNDVASRLIDHGFPVIAFSNPLRGPSDDSAYLRDFLSTIQGPIVLVGHSYGGVVITNAATGNPNVRGLVEATRAALGEQGFGILTETDLKSTLKTKLDGRGQVLARRGRREEALETLLDARRRSRRVPDGYRWVDAWTLEALCRHTPDHQRGYAHAIELTDLTSSTGMLHLLELGMRHRARWGEAACLEFADQLAHDSPTGI